MGASTGVKDGMPARSRAPGEPKRGGWDRSASYSVNRALTWRILMTGSSATVPAGSV
jgi:hypothetical protein